MSVSIGLNTIEEGLVFYYDMTNSQKSFKGKPTTNTCTFGTYNYGYNSTKISNAIPPVTPPVTGYPIYKITSNDGNDSQQILYTANVDQVNGGTYTHSAYVYLESGTWVSAGQHWNPWDYGTQQYIPKNVWTRIEDPVTNSANNYGNVAMCYNTNGAVYITGSQYELGSFASPLVNGTRSSTQAILDLTNNNTITINSLTYASDGTFSFNGSSDYISSITGLSAGTNNFTCEVWAYNSGNGFLITPQSNGIDNWVSINSSNWNITYTQSADVNNRALSTSGTTAPIGTWSCCTFSIVGNTVYFWVNGSYYGSQTETFTIGNWGGVNWIFGQRGNSTNWFNGKIGNVKVYNRKLSDQEVSQNFQALRGRYGI